MWCWISLSGVKPAWSSFRNKSWNSCRIGENSIRIGGIGWGNFTSIAANVKKLGMRHVVLQIAIWRWWASLVWNDYVLWRAHALTQVMKAAWFYDLGSWNINELVFVLPLRITSLLHCHRRPKMMGDTSIGAILQYSASL